MLTYVSRGLFFDKAVNIISEKDDTLLVSFLLEPHRTVYLSKKAITLCDTHEKQMKETYNLCRYLSKTCYQKFNVQKLNSVSLLSIFFLLNYTHYCQFGKQLFSEDFSYEKRKLGHFNPYFYRAVRLSKGYGSIVNDFKYDNHIPVNLTNEQKEFIDNTIFSILSQFPALEWPDLYEYELTLMESDSMKEFLSKYGYEREKESII